jgi:hypothetical protein
VPAPTPCEMASLLDLPGPRLQAYARETVVAEKLRAFVVLGLTTSRMKDLYDLELLRRTFSFDQRLHEAVAARGAGDGVGRGGGRPAGLVVARAAGGRRGPGRSSWPWLTQGLRRGRAAGGWRA